MFRYAVTAAVLTMLSVLPAAPSFAVTAKQKMETCKFGADYEKLHGAARRTFISKCMANRNDPRGPAPQPAVRGAAAPKH